MFFGENVKPDRSNPREYDLRERYAFMLGDGCFMFLYAFRVLRRQKRLQNKIFYVNIYKE